MRERITFPAYDRVSNFLSPEELISAHAHYCGEVAMVDRWLGHLLNTAAALNLLDDTAIIFVSDHGYLFGEKDTIGKHITVDRGCDPVATLAGYFPHSDGCPYSWIDQPRQRHRWVRPAPGHPPYPA